MELPKQEDVAAESESEIKIREFLRAIAIRSGGYAPQHLTVEVACHFRSCMECAMHNARASGRAG
jgi:hypothetical protein